MRRRDWALVLLGGAAAAEPAAAQTSASEDLAAAKERVTSNRAELARFSIPMATEPAFVFKA